MKNCSTNVKSTHSSVSVLCASAVLRRRPAQLAAERGHEGRLPIQTNYIFANPHLESNDSSPNFSLYSLQLAPILFGVVVVFVVCNSLRVVLNIYDFRDESICC